MERSIRSDDVRFRRRIDEDERLAVLELYGILDTVAEPKYERLAETLRIGCRAGWSTITFVDSDRQWFKASSKCALTETPRSVSFCSVNMLQDEPLIVEDARLDPRFRDNALVTGAPFVRFYAGFPIFSREGFGLGSVCVLHTVPRTLGMGELELIRLGRDWVQAELEIRRMTRYAVDGFVAYDELFHERKRHYNRLERVAWKAVEEAFAGFNLQLV